MMSAHRIDRIIADWNGGGMSMAQLSARWGDTPSAIKDILRRARISGVYVLSVDPAEGTRPSVEARRANQAAPRYDTAFSINDLTPDAYRIVANRTLVGGRNRWDSTIPDAEMGLLNDETRAGRVFSPQATVGEQLVRLARIVRITARGGR